MERMMPTALEEPPAQHLHETNHRLKYWLEGLLPVQSEIPVATPEQMAGLLSELLRAGEWLRASLPRERNPELEAELGKE